MPLSRIILAAALFLALGLLAGCAPEDLPPVFNAIDPSLQCPAGQVGWDFATGGNQTDIVVPPVGNEVRVQKVEYGCYGTARDGGQDSTQSVDLTQAFKYDCDNAKVCTRKLVNADAGTPDPLTCPVNQRYVYATYKCGTETKTYNISRAPHLLDYTRSYPNALWQMEDWQGRNGPDSQLTFICANTVKVRSMVYSVVGGRSVQLEPQNIPRCDGARRCFGTPFVIPVGWDTLTPDKLTVYYSCGTSETLSTAEGAFRSNFWGNGVATSVPAGKMLDVSCASEGTVPGTEPTPVMYLKDVTLVRDDLPQTPSRVGDPGLLATLKAQLFDRCNGKRSCEVDTRGALPGFAEADVLKVEYWCGTSRSFPELRYFDVKQLQGNSVSFVVSGNVPTTSTQPAPASVKLQCGGRMLVATNSGAPSWLAGVCGGGARGCSLPPGQPAPAAPLQFACEGLKGTYDSSSRFYKGAQSPRSIECPLETANYNGITLVGIASQGQTGAIFKPDVQAVGACQGKSFCTVTYGPLSTNTYDYVFTCSGTGETRNARPTPGPTSDTRTYYLDCTPAPQVNKLKGCVDGGVSMSYLSDARYGNVNRCAGLPGTCSFDLAGANLWEQRVAIPALRSCTQDIRVEYTCGSDPATLTQTISAGTYVGAVTADGGWKGADGGSLFRADFRCAYDPTPRANPSTKKCIDEFCANTRKRNAAMECVADPEITVFPDLWHHPIINDPVTFAEPTDVTEGTLYVQRMYMQGGAPFTAGQSGTMWAYDVFTPKAGGPEVYGFRCLVMAGGLNWSASNYAVFGGWKASESQVLPTRCFADNLPITDKFSSWSNAARRAGINDVKFRADYQRTKTYLVSAFDVKGRAVLARKSAPNPIGFFYDPATGAIDQYAYYAQQTNFAGKREVRFNRSRQIDLSAVRGVVDNSAFILGATSSNNLPVIHMNFTWVMTGDSSENPFSPNFGYFDGTNIVSRKRLRASLEIAKEDASLANKWVTSNSAVIGTVELGGFSAKERTDRLSLALPPDVVKRMISRRGTSGAARSDGWMNGNTDVQSTFKVRACLDMDGLARTVDQTDIDNRYLPAVSRTVTVDNVTQQASFKLGFTKRCTEEFPIVVTRDLFPLPQVPAAPTYKPNDDARTTAQGGTAMGLSNDEAVQGACRTQCTVNADCGAGGVCQRPAATDGGVQPIGWCVGGKSMACSNGQRSGMTLASSAGFGMSLLSIDNRAKSGPSPQPSTMPVTRTQSSATAVGFTILDSDEVTAPTVKAIPTRFEFEVTLGRAWAAGAALYEVIFRNARAGTERPWYRPTVMKPSSGADSVPGIAFGIAGTKLINAGPVTLMLEYSAGVGIGFDLGVKIVLESTPPSVAAGTETQYKCFNKGSNCITLVSSPKTQAQAYEDCVTTGQRLVQIPDSAKLASVRTAAANKDVWIGAVGAHLFDDPSCTDLSRVPAAEVAARVDSCQKNSVTSFRWLEDDARADGGVMIAVVKPDAGVVLNRPENHGFGVLTQFNNDNGAPFPTGVLLKANGGPEARRTGVATAGGVTVGSSPTEAAYLCEAPNASAYSYSSVTFGPKIEFNAGLSAFFCYPSTVIGACIGAEFKFITAGLSYTNGSEVYRVWRPGSDPNGRADVEFGSNGKKLSYEAAFLTGQLKAELRFVFSSAAYVIFSYAGVAHFEGDLWDGRQRYRQ